ncbi:hypothetical protein [Pseudomonas sp. M5]|uniref:hypothetical protein n=1 Tax=Pseudomonas sp. M5 TaxID=1620788 RepID=UPI00195E8EE8|nr:hypothetical protein [Pseudomonas sp. M5]MBM7397414.1 hypothetical protein [Pseudomonas sp. M5]HDS1756197.1 hypothetical protein [Pseudomonas putida]
MSSSEPDLLLTKAKHTVERKRRGRIVSMFLPALVGTMLIPVITYFYDVLKANALVLPISFLAIILIGGAAGFVVINYLQTGFELSKDDEVEVELTRLRNPLSIKGMLGPEMATYKLKAPAVLVEELKSLREDFESVKGLVDVDAFMRVSKEDGEYRRNFLSDSAAEVAEKANAILSSQVMKLLKNDMTQKLFEECRMRLLQEIRDLNRKGSINLSIGAAISAIGILLLGATLVFEVVGSTDLMALISHYLPRLSLIVLIEVLAYFFLRLYKASLAEVKYFQNELTNIEAKQIAVNVAREAGDCAMVGVVVAKLADTERNHVLTKDQTTVELEKAKLESESKVAFGKFVTDFFQKVKSN